MDEDLALAASEARAYHPLRFWCNSPMVLERQGRGSVWRGPLELLEQANMKDIMDAGVGWQVEADGDVVDELGDAVGAEEA